MGLPALIDCHAHLADAVFDSDRQAVLDNARAAGVVPDGGALPDPSRPRTGRSGADPDS